MTVTTQLSTRVDVPEAAFNGDKPLAFVARGAYVASVHRGVAAVTNAEGETVVSIGDRNQPVFLRSAAKPFQAMPAILTGAVDRFRLSSTEIAVLCASHNAEQRHTETVLSALAKGGLDESALRCGTHPPLHALTAVERIVQGIEPSAVCNNCSGAHTGMLLACRAAGWSIENYEAPDHPLQIMTRRIMAQFSGLPAGAIECGIDNCLVPTFRLPIVRAAQAFARLASGSGVGTELENAARTIRTAMTTHPEMVAGEERYDTDLMQAAGGSLAAKGGADGFQGIAIISQGLGLAIKISDGGSRAIPPATITILAALGALTEGELASLESYRVTHVHDRVGRTVGRIAAAFSLDEEE